MYVQVQLWKVSTTRTKVHIAFFTVNSHSYWQCPLAGLVFKKIIASYGPDLVSWHVGVYAVQIHTTKAELQCQMQTNPELSGHH